MTGRAGRTVRRAARYAVVLWAACTLNFALPQLAPGDPVDYLFGGEANALSQQDRQTLRAEYGVDGPVLAQYGRYWGSLARGNLGVSLTQNRPVLDVIRERLPWTLALVSVATLISATVAVALGVAAARRRGRRRDIALVSGLLVLDSMPLFFVAMVLVAVFSVELGLFPSFGAVALEVEDGAAWLVAVAHRMVLPVSAVTLATLGETFLLARASMISALGHPYVAFAEAKGVPPRRIAYRHALRNALLPVTTNVTTGIGTLISGSVVVETVFAYPGLGSLVYDAVVSRDYPLLQGAFLVITIGVVAANALAEFLYPRLDPRVRRPARAQVVTA